MANMPPPYTQNAQIPVCSRTIGERPPPYSAREEPYPVERLRRILLYCLAVDYGVEDIVPPDYSERVWFIHVYYSLSFHFHSRREGWHCDISLLSKCRKADYFKYILGPSIALGIPDKKVLQRLAAFEKSRVGKYRYPGGWKVLTYRKAAPLVDKFLDDKNILINAVVPPTDPTLRARLLTGLKDKQVEYFHSLDSRDSYVLTPLGASIGGPSGSRRAAKKCVAFAKTSTTKVWKQVLKGAKSFTQTKPRYFRNCEGCRSGLWP